MVKKAWSQDAALKGSPNGTSGSTDQDPSINPLEPKELIKRLGFALPDEGLGKDGLTDILQKILQYSVNTWSQGFLHKLYATTNPIGVVSELILAVLNTNVRISQNQDTARSCTWLISKISLMLTCAVGKHSSTFTKSLQRFL